MRRRLPGRGKVNYQAIRDNFVWPDHVLRLLVTAGAIAWLNPETVLDPACGDASIVKAAHKLSPIKKAFLGDISQPQIAKHWGYDFGFEAALYPTEAMELLNDLAIKVDVVVLTEILEHVEDPDAVVAAARAKGKYLVASSPINESESVGNHEHVWTWDEAGYREMLEAAGWKPKAYTEIAFPKGSGYPYTYQLWVCE